MTAVSRYYPVHLERRPSLAGAGRVAMNAGRHVWAYAAGLWHNTALLRIEDVHPALPVEDLDRALGMCEARGIPVAIGVIPRFVDGATVVDLGGAVAARLRRAAADGAVLGLHGLTHQRGEGVTAADYEYAPGDDVEPTEAARRLVEGRAILAAEGLFPRFWETPHYTCDEERHRAMFTQAFPWQFERYPPGVSHSLQSRSVVRLGPVTWFPENLYYIPGYADDAWVDQMLAHAARLRCVPSAVAGTYVHTFVRGELVARLLDGMLELGFVFRSLPDAARRTRPRGRGTALADRLRKAALIATGFDDPRALPPPVPIL